MNQSNNIFKEELHQYTVSNDYKVSNSILTIIDMAIENYQIIHKNHSSCDTKNTLSIIVDLSLKTRNRSLID